MVVACVVAATCSPAAFLCEEHPECGPEGQCQPIGYCSFPDPACPSGQRFGDAAAELSGACVDAQTGGDGETSDGSAGEATAGPGSTMTVGGSGDSSGAVSGASQGTGDGEDSLEGDTGSDGVAESGTDPSSDEGAQTGTTSADTTTTSATTGSVEGDPYGMCPACEYPDATCLMGMSGVSICAPPCTDQSGCPDPVDPEFDTKCLDLGDGTSWCVIDCNGQACPTGMTCAPNNVCAWP